MSAGNWQATDSLRTNLLNGTFDWDSDTFKISLMTSSAVMVASTGLFSTVSAHEVSGNGYAAATCSITLSGTTLVTVDGTDCVWTASGGSIVAKYATLYEDAGNVAYYCLLDTTSADVTVTDGNTLTLQISASGIFTLS